MEHNTDTVYNFSAGPAALPKAVMLQAQAEFVNWNHLGTSVMEISHRSQPFIQVAEHAERDLRDLLNIPDNYKVLFCQGGARAQFAAVPLNLLGDAETATYIDAGYWAMSAVKEAKKYCTVDVFDAKIEKEGKIAVLPASEWRIANMLPMCTSARMKRLMVLKSTICLSQTNRLLPICLRPFYLVKLMYRNTA